MGYERIGVASPGMDLLHGSDGTGGERRGLVWITVRP